MRASVKQTRASCKRQWVPVGDVVGRPAAFEMDLPPTDDLTRSEPSEYLVAEVDALSVMLPRATQPSGDPVLLFPAADAGFDVSPTLPTDL